MVGQTEELEHEVKKFLTGILKQGEDNGKNRMCEVIVDLGVEWPQKCEGFVHVTSAPPDRKEPHVC